MEKFYVANAYWSDCETEKRSILGIFSDIEKAKKACENYGKNYDVEKEYGWFDEDNFMQYAISAYTIDVEDIPKNPGYDGEWVATSSVFKCPKCSWDCERCCDTCEKAP